MRYFLFIILFLSVNISYAELSQQTVNNRLIQDFSSREFTIQSSGLVIKSSDQDLKNLKIIAINKNNYAEELDLHLDADFDSQSGPYYFFINTFETQKYIIKKEADFDFEINFFEVDQMKSNSETLSFLGSSFNEQSIIPRSKWLQNDESYRSSSTLGNLVDLSYVSSWKNQEIFSIDFKENGKWLNWPINYLESVDTIVIHHTASTKLLNDPVQAINNIYTYHTQVRGWGDIGYHYLVAPNGKIYQGKFGGDVAMGGHSVPVNRHSLGIAVLGNFEEQKPNYSTLNALSDLIALKSEKFNLDPNGKVKINNSIFDVIQGHRDNDQTLCPGINLYKEIPNIKQKVLSRLGKLDNEYTKNISSLSIDKEGEILNLTVGQNVLKTYEITYNNPKGVLKQPEIIADKNLKISISSFKQTAKNKYKLQLKILALKEYVNSELTFKFLDDLNLIIPSNAFEKLPELEFKETSFECQETKCNIEIEVKNPGKVKALDLEVGLSKYNSKNNFPDFKISPSRLLLKPKQTQKIQVAVENSKKYKGNVYLNIFNEKGALASKDIQIKFPSLNNKVEMVKTVDFDFKKQENIYQSINLKFPISAISNPSFEVDQDVLVKKARVMKIGGQYNVFFRVKHKQMQGEILNYELKSGSQLIYKGQINFGKTNPAKIQTNENLKNHGITENFETDKLQENQIKVLLSKVNMQTLEFSSSKDTELKINSRIKKLKANQVVKVSALNKGMILTINGKVSPANRLELIAQDENIVTLLNYENRPAFNIELNDNQFRGGLKISANQAKLEVMNVLSLESYLKGLAEISDFEHPEKIKTILVAARSYAYHYITDGVKFPGKDYNLNDDPNVSQKYLGYGFEKRAPNVVKEVINTKGQMVTYENKVIKVPYFSQSNGSTKSAFEVWGWTDTPYLKSVKDDCPETEFKGHGVGISGCGAKNMALKNKTFQEIISYYLPGTKIKTFK